MSSVPLLSDAQWSRIENSLPENRRDRTVIAAILYLEHSGQPLRHVGEQYGLSQTRLHEWHRAIEADGTRGRIMAALKLEPASAPARGDRPFHSHNPAMVAQVTALRLRNFGDALRAGANDLKAICRKARQKPDPHPQTCGGGGAALGVTRDGCMDTGRNQFNESKFALVVFIASIYRTSAYRFLKTSATEVIFRRPGT